MITIDKVSYPYFKEHLEHLKKNIIEDSEFFQHINSQPALNIFLSIGFDDKRATVLNASGKSFSQVWTNIENLGYSYLKNLKEMFISLKIDIVTKVTPLTITEFINRITNTKKNYFRQGISFNRDFKHAFLEQELNGNAVIQIDPETKRGFIHERNLQSYISKHRPKLKPVNFKVVEKVYIFETQGYFYENGKYYKLHHGIHDNGRRNTPLNAEEVNMLVNEGQKYLASLSKPNGKFVYGFFSYFDKEIKHYNSLRHCSTIYSMIEAYEFQPTEEAAEAIVKGIQYLIREKVYIDEEKNIAYVIDGEKPDNKEIKLGAIATAVLAMTKYTEVFNDTQYIPLTQKLARGIIQMQQENGKFVHILDYPSLALKEEFRIVYYDGEACFALMRLYKIDRDEQWLHTVEKAFEYFIESNHWKHHDHWLSYCTNEITLYKPERKYYKFGLQNVQNRLDYIYKRITTYPTFLELMMAAYQMVSRMKTDGYNDLIDELDFDESKLEATIHRRAEYQRNGFFYPELAMYFKNPKRIVGSFFIRHHSFRTRIDDVEHYLSGYCAYYNLFLKGDKS
ncbi:hypothetical protein [Oceanobacillus sojae]|uniref:Poly(Glycerol-phosphate) alpha-glucosyltransferase n=1 Tax=Oceanobacillus sojae TaxID=582851 RepID=A0A511ZNU7_9BACI|nr:hypothetical protein [Oceanobacillus sojae]GEN89124.1 hypothetical protein OSO01_38630 [Oceanobacillus sojae]